jgi:hypothetical protein
VAVPALIDLWSRCCGCHGISHLVDAVPLPASLSCVLGGQNEACMTRWITLHHRVGTAARALRGATLVLWVASIATALAPVQPSTAQISDGPTITPADLAQFDAWTNGPAHASASESGLGAARIKVDARPDRRRGYQQDQIQAHDGRANTFPEGP